MWAKDGRTGEDELGIIHLFLLSLAREEGVPIVLIDRGEEYGSDTPVYVAAPWFHSTFDGDDLRASVDPDMGFHRSACPTTALALALTAALRDASPQGGDTP